jgi:hypothetical protein
LLQDWINAHQGPRFQTELTGRIGYDTLRYNMLGGPIAGNSLLFEASGTAQPFNEQVFGTLRFDGEKYFHIYGPTAFFLRLGTGTTAGGILARQFYLSSFDTIRGIPYGRQDFLLGRNFGFSTAQLNIPLNGILRVIILSNIEAVGGMDFGGVGSSWNEAWDHRVLSPVVGANFALGPLIMRLHFAKPLNIGAPAGLPNATTTSPGGGWVTNFSIRILGFEGFFDRKLAVEGPAQTDPHAAFVGSQNGGMGY